MTSDAFLIQLHTPSTLFLAVAGKSWQELNMVGSIS